MLRLGIDFGTCYSSAALLLEGIPTPINAPLTPGYSLPSSVFITEQGEILVGQVAENNRQKNPQSYRREFKRDLGSPDPYTMGNICMLPEELVTEILKKLKSEAEKVAQGRGEKSLTDVLITVPATYSSYKRNLMQEAGEKAGFSQIKLLEEPVAAAIYYSHHAHINDGDIILVYDLGGGTFDATLMQKQGDKYQVLGMPKGLAYCGGTDFDCLIYQQLKKSCSAELRQQLEPKNAWLARAIVGDLCRDLKHQLSEQSTASVYIPMGLGNVESFELTREAFNEMISPLIEDTLDCCEQLVRSAGKNWTQVNRLLLVGGSSRIPYVKEAIEKRLKISPFLVDKPELAVCLGAAIDGFKKPEPREPRQPRQPREKQGLIVSPLGENHYRTITEAIQAAQPGETILVRPGLYHDHLILDKPLDIIGDGAIGTIIIEGTEAPCLQMQTKKATVRRLTLRTKTISSEKRYCAVDITQGQLLIEDCHISSDSLSGVAIHGPTSQPILRRCKIHNSSWGDERPKSND